MTPTTPVVWIHLDTSDKYWMFPLAMTGMLKASTTFKVKEKGYFSKLFFDFKLFTFFMVKHSPAFI